MMQRKQTRQQSLTNKACGTAVSQLILQYVTSIHKCLKNITKQTNGVREVELSSAVTHSLALSHKVIRESNQCLNTMTELDVTQVL